MFEGEFAPNIGSPDFLDQVQQQFAPLISEALIGQPLVLRAGSGDAREAMEGCAKMHQLRDRRYDILAWLTLGIALTGTQFASSARAGVLYDNGPIIGTQGSGAPTITSSEVVDSFDISSASTITGTANVGLWVTHGDVPSTVDWSIRTAPFSGVLASGTASWSASFLFTNAFNFDIYSGSFSIPDLPVTAGTYYLALSNAVTVPTGQTFWDRSGGPSQVFNGGIEVSNSFQIIGNVGGPVSAPEPATIGLMALSLVALRRLRLYL